MIEIINEGQNNIEIESIGPGCACCICCEPKEGAGAGSVTDKIFVQGGIVPILWGEGEKIAFFQNFIKSCSKTFFE